MRISNAAIISVVLLVPLLFVLFYLAQNDEVTSFRGFESEGGDIVKVDRVTIFVDVAATREKRRQGLSGRESLEKNSGLLFVFDTSDRHGIWMRDMRFPIDVIWIGGNLRVVDIASNVQPSSFPSVFTPRANARYVLEVNALFAEEKGIQIGDTVEIPDMYKR